MSISIGCISHRRFSLTDRYTADLIAITSSMGTIRKNPQLDRKEIEMQSRTSASYGDCYEFILLTRRASGLNTSASKSMLVVLRKLSLKVELG